MVIADLTGQVPNTAPAPDWQVCGPVRHRG